MLKLVEHGQDMLFKVCEILRNCYGNFLAVAGLQTLFLRCFEGIVPFSWPQGLVLRSAKIAHLFPHQKRQQ